MNRTEPFSFFVPTRIEYGAGKVSQLIDEVKGLNAKRPLIVTDKGLIKAGALKGIEEQLKEGRHEIVFDKRFQCGHFHLNNNHTPLTTPLNEKWWSLADSDYK